MFRRIDSRLHEFSFIVHEVMNFQKLIFFSLFIFLLSCSNGGDDGPTVHDSELRVIISEQPLSGDPALNRNLPSITEPLAQLGMKLFFTKALGGEFDSACVSCHHPVLGGGDDLSLPIGVEATEPDLLGPGRKHPSGNPTVPRNAPTTFNVSLWDNSLFHDGRVESLGKTVGVNGEDGQGIRTPDTDFDTVDPLSGPNLSVAQARFPVTSAEEMRTERFVVDGSNEDVRRALASRLSAMEGWPAEFQSVFGDPTISYDRIALAIGAYERSQTFVENDWKAYVLGDNSALSNGAKRGALLFFQEPADGGAGCVRCHSGDFFTDQKYHVLGFPQVGPGKGNGGNGTDDFGRFRETGLEKDRYAFRTPSMLNVAQMGPYGHAGSFETLEEVIEYHLDPASSFASYSTSSLRQGVQENDMQANTQEALDKLAVLQADGTSKLPASVELTSQEVSDLVSFLNALTDPCVTERECLASWIPTPEQDVDGFQVVAFDENGNPL